jgi:hypothetical protein
VPVRHQRREAISRLQALETAVVWLRMLPEASSSTTRNHMTLNSGPLGLGLVLAGSGDRPRLMR